MRHGTQSWIWTPHTGSRPWLRALNAADQAELDAQPDRPAVAVDLLNAAARSGNLRVLARLVELGLDIDNRDSTGRTPLLDTVLGGHTSSLQYLAAVGAQLDLADSDGKEPVKSRSNTLKTPERAATT